MFMFAPTKKGAHQLGNTALVQPVTHASKRNGVLPVHRRAPPYQCLQGMSDSLQTKLEVSRPGDELEQEADRVAEQVMRMPQVTEVARPPEPCDPAARPLPGDGEILPREAQTDEAQEEEVQRACASCTQGGDDDQPALQRQADHTDSVHTG